MGIFNYIETFFFISLGITFVLILLLVYHFKERISNLEEKNNTMFDIVNNIFNELSTLKQSLFHKQYYEISQMNSSHLNDNECSDIVCNIEVPMIKSQIEIVTEPYHEFDEPIKKSVETDTIWENSEDDDTDDDANEDSEDSEDNNSDYEDTNECNDANVITNNDNGTEPTLVLNDLVNNYTNEDLTSLHNESHLINNVIVDENLYNNETSESFNDETIYSNVFIDDINKRIQELDRPSILDDLTTLSESCNIMDDLINLSPNEITNLNKSETKTDQLKETIHDYKKLNLTQLKQLVVVKGLTIDTSKLKKHELLKLLE